MTNKYDIKGLDIKRSVKKSRIKKSKPSLMKQFGLEEFDIESQPTRTKSHTSLIEAFGLDLSWPIRKPIKSIPANRNEPSNNSSPTVTTPQQELNEIRNDVYKQLLETIESLESDKKVLLGLVNELSKRNEESTKIIRKLEIEVLELSLNLNAAAIKSDEQLEATKEKIKLFERLEESVQTLNMEINICKNENLKFRDEIQSQNALIQGLKDLLATQTELYAKSEETNKHLKTEIDNLSRHLIDTIEALENSNSTLEDSLSETQEQNQLLEEDVVTLTHAIRDLDDDIRDLRLDLKDSREEYDELQSKCEEYLDKIENLNDDVIALEDKIAFQQQNISDAQVELKATVEQLELQRAKKRKLKETLFTTQLDAKRLALHSQAGLDSLQEIFREKEASELALLAQVRALNERNQVLEKMISERDSAASITYKIQEKCNTLISQFTSLKDTGSSTFARDFTTFTRNLGMFAHAGILARNAATFERNIEGNNNQSSQHSLPLRASNEGGAIQGLNETSNSRDPLLRLYPNLQRR